jgi:hypothetical protein
MKALTFLNTGSIFLLPEESTEKRIARRQLSIKDVDSASWFIEMKKILIKYGLPDINRPSIGISIIIISISPYSM